MQTELEIATTLQSAIASGQNTWDVYRGLLQRSYEWAAEQGSIDVNADGARIAQRVWTLTGLPNPMEENKC